MVGKIIVLDSHQANNFLLPRHYSGRKPKISKAFGWIVDDRLQAVVTFGKPASPAVCKGICGDKWANAERLIQELINNGTLPSEPPETEGRIVVNSHFGRAARAEIAGTILTRPGSTGRNGNRVIEW